jgi:acetyl esterase/lipase
MKILALALPFALAACPSLLSAIGVKLGEGDHVYHRASGQDLTVTVSYPDKEKHTGPHAAMILLHGGGWRSGSPAWTASTADFMVENGIVALNTQYRLSRDGLTPKDAMDDACAALAWTRANAEALNIDIGRIGFYGVSAGGHLAASTATIGCGDWVDTPSVLVLYSPAIRTSHDGWFQKLAGDAYGPEDLSPYDHVRFKSASTLIISGEEDTLTPHAYAVEFCENMDAVGNICEVEAFEGVGHLLTRNLANQESDFDVAPESIERARAAILDFLKREGFVDGS